MKLPLLTSSACVLGLLVSACGSSSSRTDSPIGKQEQTIQGGQTDPDHTSVVGMYMETSSFMGMCSGTLIAPNLVLTARHCVSPITPDPEYVACGQSTFGTPYPASDFSISTDIQLSREGSWHQALEVRVPETSNQVCGYDEALVILQDNIETVPPYIPRIDVEATTGEPYTAVGYGQTGGTTYSFGGARMDLGGLTVRCGSGECGFGEMEATEFLGDTGVCQGDSGGPALDANGKIIGVVSRGGTGCTSPIYSAVLPWADWISQVARDAAERGGYAPPFWSVTGKSDPDPSTPSGTGGSGGGTPASPQGQACSAAAGCPTGYACLDNGSGSAYCAAACNATTPCASGLTCNGLGVCENAAAPSSSSSDSGSGGCALGAGGDGPVKPVPWLIGLSIALAGVRRRRSRSR